MAFVRQRYGKANVRVQRGAFAAVEGSELVALRQQ